jgi:hypothetical protein
MVHDEIIMPIATVKIVTKCVDDVSNVLCCYIRELLTSTTSVTTITIVTGQIVSVATVVDPSLLLCHFIVV